jgi:3-oxoacyl-[acyl-carrier protein] reductase
MDFELKGKKALVCGASQGIGRACAQILAAQGAEVVALARNETLLQGLMKELSLGNHSYLTVDLLNHEKLKSEVARVMCEKNGFDILICNAGGPSGGSLLDADAEGFLNAFKMHVISNSILSQLLIPDMKKNNYGRIVNVISTSVKAPIPNLGVSNTIRAAVASWAKSLSLEVGEFGITVNNVLPGYTKTSRLEGLKKASAEKQKVSETRVEEMWLSQIPAKRFAEASEIAIAVSFLASPLASYINGINLPVDGGRTPSL